MKRSHITLTAVYSNTTSLSDGMCACLITCTRSSHFLTGCSLERWAGGLKRHLGRTLTTATGAAAVWQIGFFDHVLRNLESYTEKWEYVRLNPVRAGLCGHPEEWRWQGEIVPLRY